MFDGATSAHHGIAGSELVFCLVPLSDGRESCTQSGDRKLWRERGFESWR